MQLIRSLANVLNNWVARDSLLKLPFEGWDPKMKVTIERTFLLIYYITIFQIAIKVIGCSVKVVYIFKEFC